MVIADRRPALVVLIGRISDGHFHGGRPVIGILGGAYGITRLLLVGKIAKNKHVKL